MPKVGLRKDNQNKRLLEGEYQRANGTYEYRYTDKFGKRKYIYAKDLQALRKKKELLANELKENLNDASKLTVNDFYEKWKKLKEGTIKDNVFRAYCYFYTQYTKDTIGNMKIGDVKKSDIKAYYKKLHNTPYNLKITSIDNVHTVLHQVLQVATDDMYIKNNPSDKCLEFLKKAHGSDKTKIHALTVNEQKVLEEDLYTNPKDKQWMPFIITMLYTGMRIGEVTGLQWEDIDFENNYIYCRHTLVYYDKRQENRRCEYSMNSPKTEAGNRTIPLLEKVKDALLELKEMQKANNIKCKVSVDGFDDFVFVNRFGGVYNQGTINKVIKRIIRDINDVQLENNSDILIPMFSSHTFRHTFITRCVEKGIPLPIIMDIVGHNDIETTLNIYNEVQNEFKTREMTKLNDYFKGF